MRQIVASGLGKQARQRQSPIRFLRSAKERPSRRSSLAAPYPLLDNQASNHVSFDVDGRTKGIQKPVNRQ